MVRFWVAFLKKDLLDLWLAGKTQVLLKDLYDLNRLDLRVAFLWNIVSASSLGLTYVSIGVSLGLAVKVGKCNFQSSLRILGCEDPKKVIRGSCSFMEVLVVFATDCYLSWV